VQLSPPLDLSKEFQMLDQFSSEFLDTGLKFESQFNKEIGTKIPDDIKLRPFYFIRLLQESMANGAFITSEVFINKQVWD
jgi:hypothetical protein